MACAVQQSHYSCTQDLSFSLCAGFHFSILGSYTTRRSQLPPGCPLLPGRLADEMGCLAQSFEDGDVDKSLRRQADSTESSARCLRSDGSSLRQAGSCQSGPSAVRLPSHPPNQRNNLDRTYHYGYTHSHGIASWISERAKDFLSRIPSQYIRRGTRPP